MRDKIEKILSLQGCEGYDAIGEIIALIAPELEKAEKWDKLRDGINRILFHILSNEERADKIIELIDAQRCVWTLIGNENGFLRHGTGVVEGGGGGRMSLRDKITKVIWETTRLPNRMDSDEVADQILALIEGERCEWTYKKTNAGAMFFTGCNRTIIPWRIDDRPFCPCCGKRIELQSKCNLRRIR